jgi:hypothetical protein
LPVRPMTTHAGASRRMRRVASSPSVTVTS